VATKRRSAIKKRIVPTKEVKRQQQYEKDYKIALKQVQKVNQRLKSLERGFAKGKGTWSVKLLRDKMDTNKIGAWKNNRLTISKDMTRTQLIAVQRASSQFLASKTSTKKGVNEVRELTKESLYKTLKLQDDNLTMADIDDFYTLIGDADARPFLKTDVMGGSALQIAISDAISYNDTEQQFLERMETFINIADSELREKARRLYKKYVKPKVLNLFEDEELDLAKDFNLF
jgi:hypothetical protein